MSDREYAAYCAKLDAEFAAKHPTLGRTAEDDYKLITLGYDENNVPFQLDEIVRMSHSHLVGATGGGKSAAMVQAMQQDVGRGRGLILLDPHGSHPDSPFAQMLAWIERMGFDATGRVIVIDPNVADPIIGFNPLARLPGTDLSVIADALLEAFQRAWGDEDLHAKPNILTVLTATFIALAEKGLTLCEAKSLYQRDDPHGVRARLIADLQDEFAKEELERLHELASDPRSRADFNAQVVGPINRLNVFLSAPAVRTMLGQTENTLDFLDVMDKGKIVLVNLSPGAKLSEDKAKLLGTIVLRYLFLLCKQRRSAEPFFLYVDECHGLLSGDVAALLSEARKFRVGVLLAHQFLFQLRDASELIYQAVMATTVSKVVFRMELPEEARLMAEMVIPFDVETPVAASIRPTAVGQMRVRLPSASRSLQTSESEAVSESVGEMEAHTIGSASAVTSATSTATGASELASQLSTPPLLLFGPNAENASAMPMLLSQSAGTGQSQLDSASQAQSQISSEATTYARTKALSQSKGQSRGISETEGWHEAFETLFENLPTAFHSLDTLRYLAGERIRALPIGKAFVRSQGKCACVTIPDPKTKPYG